MDIPQFIRDNTGDGQDIVTFLIEAMNGGIDGCTLGHRLTAARLLVIYGHAGAPDFIADNASPPRQEHDKQWLTIDPVWASLIRDKTNNGKDMCLLLIEVMQGRIKKASPGHRVSAAKELLNRAFGKSASKPLPKPQHTTVPSRSNGSVQAAPVAAPETSSAPAAETTTAVLDRPDQQAESESETNSGIVIDMDNDPYFAVLDSPRYDHMSYCEDPDFDPYLATIDEDYFKSYTGCKDPECEVHSEVPEIDFDPNDHHY